MSYIDTFEHQYVANFAGLPLYYPLATVNDSGGGDFGCDPRNLVLGGGGGEHPGLVFHRLDCLAVRFVLHAVPDPEDESHTVHDQFGDFPIFEYLGVDNPQLFEFSGWSVRHYHSFFENCSSGAMTWPFGADEHLSFEEWLAISIGEFVWFSFPELIRNLLPVRQMYPDLRPIASNVLTLPPGYPELFGLRTQDGKSIWGNHRFNKHER